MKKVYTYLLLLLIVLGSSINANAQCNPLLRPDSTQLIFNSAVNTSAKVGNILYVGGTFTRVSRNTGSFVKADGITTGNPQSLGTWPKTNGAVTAIVSDGTGGWIIGGTFTQVGSSTRNRIAQINAAGQLTSWDPNANGQVSALYRNGTTLYIGGSFSNIGGLTRNRIASYSLISGLITTWDPNANSTVNTIAANGTDVYVGGSFTTIGGQGRSRIASLDATTGLATAWNPNVVSGSNVNKILISGSTVYFGGLFTNVGGQVRSNAAAADITTGVVTSWNPAPNNTVLDMVGNGTNILVSGTFSSIGSQSRVGVAEVDNNLGNATSRNFNLPNGSAVYNLKISGNSIYIGGSFTISATGQANMVRANLTTNTIDPWESNYNGTVYVVEGNGVDLFIGGVFTQHYRNRTYLAAIDWVGDSLLNWAPTLNNIVTAVVADANNVYVGGAFTTVNATSRSRLASISAAGSLNTWNPSSNSTVYSLVLNGSSLYAGGLFTFIGGQSRNRIAELDVTTGGATSWNPNVSNGLVQAMTIAGSNMYLGGTFTTVSATTRNRAASVSLASGTLTGWNPDMDGTVNTMLTSGSDIYVGGSFNNVGTQFTPRLAAVSQATGLPSSTWIPYPNGTINSIAIDGSVLYAAGSYTSIGGQVRDNLAALDMTSGNATSWDVAANNACNHVAVYGDRLLVGGTFTSINLQTGTPYVTQYNLLKTDPVVNITGNNNLCAGTSVTYTAVTSVAGATYQWKKNNITVGFNATYTTIPASNDQIQCIITTPIGSCYTSSTATSNTITVTTTAAITPAAAITGNTSVCVGTATTYTATTNVPTPTYQWKVNGLNVGTNNATFAYTPVDGDAVTCTIYTPVSGCFSAPSVTSNTLNITVSSPVLPTISISNPNTTICSGTSVTFTAVTNVTGGNYQWKVGTVNVGTNSPTYTASNLANNASVTCTIIIPVGGCFTASTAVSNAIVMTVNPNLAANINISGSINPCGSAMPIYTSTTNVTGGTYQWKVNSINVGTNTSTYSYAPATNDVLTCEITAAPGTCYLPASDISNALVIVPQTPVVPTATITGSNNLCAGQTGNYFVTTNVVAGTYQWKVNNINVSTNTNYSYTPVNGDVITCVVTTSASGCYTTTSVSNNFTVIVNNPALPTITITTPNTTVCSGVPVTFNGTNNNVPGGTYQWRVNGFDVFGATNSTFTYAPSNTDVVTCIITIPPGGCYLANSSFSGPITMTVTPSITTNISISADANNICLGTVVNYTATTSVTGGTFQWKVNGANVGTNSAAYSYSPVNGDVVTCVVTVPGTGCFTASTATANPVTMQVNSPVTPNITVAADHDTTCEGNNVTLTATTNITVGTFLWKVNGFNTGSNSPTHSYVPQNNDIILCSIIAPPGCFTTSTATSSLKVLKVNAKQPVSFALGAAPIVELGGTVYVNTTIPAGITTYSIEWKKNGATYATTTINEASYIKTPGIDTLTAVLTTSDGCYNPGTSPEIYVYSVGVGVNDVVKAAGIEAYPNPFNDRITIKGIAPGDKLLLFDMAGRSIITPATTGKTSATIILSEIAPGAYLLKIVSGDGIPKANIPLRKM